MRADSGGCRPSVEIRNAYAKIQAALAPMIPRRFAPVFGVSRPGPDEAAERVGLSAPARIPSRLLRRYSAMLPSKASTFSEPRSSRIWAACGNASPGKEQRATTSRADAYLHDGAFIDEDPERQPSRLAFSAAKLPGSPVGPKLDLAAVLEAPPQLFASPLHA